MILTLFKLPPVGDRRFNLYTAVNIDQSRRVCELLGIKETLLTEEQFVKLRAMSDKGENHDTHSSFRIPDKLIWESSKLDEDDHLLLAALRCYQRHLGEDAEIDAIASNQGQFTQPTAATIDALCGRINS